MLYFIHIHNKKLEKELSQDLEKNGLIQMSNNLVFRQFIHAYKTISLKNISPFSNQVHNFATVIIYGQTKDLSLKNQQDSLT